MPGAYRSLNKQKGIASTAQFPFFRSLFLICSSQFHPNKRHPIVVSHVKYPLLENQLFHNYALRVDYDYTLQVANG